MSDWKAPIQQGKRIQRIPSLNYTMFTTRIRERMKEKTGFFFLIYSVRSLVVLPGSFTFSSLAQWQWMRFIHNPSLPESAQSVPKVERRGVHIMRRTTLENIVMIGKVNGRRGWGRQRKWCWVVSDGEMEECHEIWPRAHRAEIYGEPYLAWHMIMVFPYNIICFLSCLNILWLSYDLHA